MCIVCGYEVSDDSDGSSPRDTVDNVSHTVRQTRHHQRDCTVRKRRRIIQVIDSSTEEDPDTSDNNHLQLPPIDKSDQNNTAPSVVRAKDDDPTFYQKNTCSLGCSDSGRPNLAASEQPDSDIRSVPSLLSKAAHPADHSGSGRPCLTRSRPSDSVSRSDLSIQSKAARPEETTKCLSSRVDATKDFESLKPDCDSRLLNNTPKTSNSLAANDVATFSLAFDDFFGSDCEDDFSGQVTKYTRLKEPRDGISTLGKPADDSPDIVSYSKVVEACRPVHLDCTTVSGQPDLIGSGQPSSVRSLPPKTTTSTSRSYSPAVPQFVSTSGSGQCELTGSLRPSSVANSAVSEAERLREERLRLSRLKKEQFQRKFASTSLSSQTPKNLSSVDTAVGASNMADHPQNKLQVLVDSRELSGAQVNVMF